MFPNDEVVAYGRANGLGSDYNDIMTAFLRDYYSSNLSLTDLWGRAWAEGFRSINGFTDFPGIANSGFYAPLTHSLILTRGTGDPTYSRATDAWEFDNEGVLKQLPSGAVRFGGARRIRNLISYSETFASGWTAEVGASISGATVTVGANVVDGIYHAIYLFINNVFRFTVTLSANTTIQAKIRAYNGSVDYLEDITITPTPTEFTILMTGAVLGSTGQVGIRANNSAAVITLHRAQAENVTGQADNATGEYVSRGVLSAPYHGAGIDGLKYFNTNKDGSAIAASSLLGYHSEGARTNSLLYSRDLTNAAWAATNITPAKTATGIDNAANSASTLTAGAADATILQTLTMAAAARSFSAYVKRRTGSGSVYITRDGGTSWTDITASVGASWTRVKIENTSVLNPSVGFKIATSGDAIDVDCVQDEAGASISSPIITTTAAVTRNADAETFQTASNWSDTAGWVLATVQGESWANATGTAIGNGTNGLKLSASNSGIVAYDGTNTVNGPAGSPSGAKKLAMTWGSGALQAASGGVAGSAGSYDGAWGLATVGIGTSQGNVYIKDVYIGQSALTAAQLVQVTA